MRAPAVQVALVRIEAPEIDFENSASTSMFNSLASIEARIETSDAEPTVARTLAEVRGYRREDLFALAEIAYHYLLSGGVRIAEIVFAGLVAIEPREAYFALALGMCHDRQGRREQAIAEYARASRLDPKDPRPRINMAELALEAGDRAKARQLLRAVLETGCRQDPALVRKTRVLLSKLGN
jgi:Flp pilus assembly protein TadD